MAIDVLACISNGRPGDLRSCVDSYVQHGRKLRVVVVDQTDDAARRNASRDVAAGLHRSRRVDVEYISNREIAAFLARAARFTWVDAESLRYALAGAYGAACNVAALAAGTGTVVASAATQCDVIGAPGGSEAKIARSIRETQTFASIQSDMENLWFWDSVDAIANRHPHLWDVDLLAEMERALAGCDAVSVGTWGDVGVESPGFYALSQQAASIATSEDLYMANRLNRIVHRASRATFHGEVNLRLPVFGYSKALAPCLPTEKITGGIAGQSLFGQLLNRHGRLTSVLSLAVRSATDGVQFSFDDAAETPRMVSFTDFLAVMIDSLGPQTELAAIGRGLVGMASDRAFIARTAGIWSGYIAEVARARVGGCAALRADLAAIADAGVKVLETPYRRGTSRQEITNGFLPFEFRNDTAPEQACEIFIGQVVKFGRLVAGWADLVAAVGDLDKNGVRLGAKP